MNGVTILSKAFHRVEAVCCRVSTQSPSDKLLMQKRLTERVQETTRVPGKEEKQVCKLDAAGLLLYLGPDSCMLSHC